ncbi:MAG: hypothetical protein R3E86_22515 [Pseudomonadales bacterium]
MSQPDREASTRPETAAAATLGERTARLIEDPVGSVVAGLIAPAAAVGFVVSGIYGLALIN